MLITIYYTTWIVRTCQTTFVLVTEEVLRGPAASVPVALTEAGGGVEGPLRDPGLAARPVSQASFSLFSASFGVR